MNKNSNPPDLSHLSLRTQVVPVLYVMECSSEFLDIVGNYAEASGESHVIDVEQTRDYLSEMDKTLAEIISVAQADGFSTVIFTE